jgi:hypothetical protein
MTSAAAATKRMALDGIMKASFETGGILFDATVRAARGRA